MYIFNNKIMLSKEKFIRVFEKSSDVEHRKSKINDSKREYFTLNKKTFSSLGYNCRNQKK